MKQFLRATSCHLKHISSLSMILGGGSILLSSASSMSRCESSPPQQSKSSLSEANKARENDENKTLPNRPPQLRHHQTFRKRRLTQAREDSHKKEETNTKTPANTSHPSLSGGITAPRRPTKLYRDVFLYSGEMVGLDDVDINPHLAHHDESSGSITHLLLFSKELVGTYSCHGIKPFQYEDDKEEDHTAIDNETIALLKEFQGWIMPQQHRHTHVVAVAKINQDRAGIAHPYGNDDRSALFCVCDGHGKYGDIISDNIIHKIMPKLKSHADFESNIENAFHETFLNINQGLSKTHYVPALTSGSTACVVLMRNNILHIANIGDSRAVLGRRQCHSSSSFSSSSPMFTSVNLTWDQKPDTPTEQKRIIQSGGFISSPKEEGGFTARVWLDAGHKKLGLAMSRSIGDLFMKEVGVCADPVVTMHQLLNVNGVHDDGKEEDAFLILASDGVWEFMTSQEAVEIVGQYFDDDGVGSATEACEALIEAAALKWKEAEGYYRDDITAIVVNVKDLWKEDGEKKKTQTQKL